MHESVIATAAPPRTRTGAAIEWPTFCLAIVIYGGWAGLTLFHAALPLALFVPLAAWTIAWHSSLQHEIIHGHPTRWRGLNRALGFVPLSLWLPYQRYRATHLCHHRDERLTDPLDDPESYYWTPADWARLSPPARALVRAQSTLLGRVLIGPFWCATRFIWAEGRAILSDNRRLARVWAAHLLGVAAILGWVWGVCGMSPLAYLAIFVYPGTALLLVRSFAEHRAEAEVAKRTAIVEGASLLSILYLNNNLHAAHHANPRLPWYELPGWYRRHRAALVGANGGLVYKGYGEVARRFLVKPHDRPAHPLGRAPRR